MKRTAALLLCAALLLALVPAGSAADAEDDRLGFVAINDIMPPELVDCQMFYGGVYYVPYYVFTDYGLGLSYSYFASAATAYFSTTEKQLFFDLNSGATYDGNDTHYAVSAISRGGTVYVPVGLVCRIFGGMTYSIIAGNEYGNILRLKTDAVVLSDAEFLRAARSLMRSYYQSYQSGEGGGPVPDATPEPISHEGDRALLGFVGLPGDELLKTLARYEFDACFFLTAEDARSDPDRVRRLSGEGYGLGLLGDGSAAAWREADELLFEAARVHTVLVCAPPDAEGAAEAAERSGYAWYAPDFIVQADSIPDILEETEGDVALLLDCAAASGAAEALADYLAERHYDVGRPREIDTIRRPTT